MNIEKQFKLILNTRQHRLEFECAENVYSFFAFMESGNVEASFSNLTRDEMVAISYLLQTGLES